MNYRQMAWTMHRSTHCVHVICNGAGGDVTRQRVQRGGGKEVDICTSQ